MDQGWAVRQLLAALVLFCFGITIPLAAMTWRVCLLDGDGMGREISMSQDETFWQSEDCSDCCEEDQSCCAELKKLPDSTARSGDFQLPDLIAVDHWALAFQIPPPRVNGHAIYQPARPIRGPDTPSSRRASLAVWII